MELFNNPLNFLMAGGAVGLLATMWGKIKNLFWRLLGTFIRRIEISSEDMGTRVVGYLIKNHKFMKTYDRVYGSSWELHKNEKYGLVTFEQFGERSLIFWNGWLPFLFNAKRATSKQENPTSNGSSHTSRHQLWRYLLLSLSFAAL